MKEKNHEGKNQIVEERKRICRKSQVHSNRRAGPVSPDGGGDDLTARIESRRNQPRRRKLAFRWRCHCDGIASMQ